LIFLPIKKNEAPAEGTARASEDTCSGPIAQANESIRGMLRLYKIMFFMELMQESNEAPAHERKPGPARRSTFSGAEANRNEQREHRGNKIDLQTNLFHYGIRQSNVTLYGIISARSEEAMRTGCIVYNGGQVSEAQYIRLGNC
jgi:hypothetical protein